MVRFPARFPGRPRRLLVASLAVLLSLAGAATAAAMLGSITEFKVPSPGGPNSIALGPDGALWFTEVSRPAIGRMTTTGKVTSFPIASNASPVSIVAGPDGALWFTEASGPGVGRITTSGQISEFTIPACGPCRYPPGPLGLTVGSDGALWYARPSNNALGR